MKRKISSLSWLVAWSCSERTPNSRLPVRSEMAECLSWRPKKAAALKNKAEQSSGAAVLIIFFLMRFTLLFLCKHEYRDTSHRDECTGAGNFKNQDLCTLQNSACLIFHIAMAPQRRREKGSCEWGRKEQGSERLRGKKWKSELRSTHWREGRTEVAHNSFSCFNALSRITHSQ